MVSCVQGWFICLYFVSLPKALGTFWVHKVTYLQTSHVICPIYSVCIAQNFHSACMEWYNWKVQRVGYIKGSLGRGVDTGFFLPDRVCICWLRVTPSSVHSSSMIYRTLSSVVLNQGNVIELITPVISTFQCSISIGRVSCSFFIHKVDVAGAHLRLAAQPHIGPKWTISRSEQYPGVNNIPKGLTFIHPEVNNKFDAVIETPGQLLWVHWFWIQL